jgi:hypothetical protein
MELHFHSPNTPSWRGAQLNIGTTLPLPYLYLTFTHGDSGGPIMQYAHVEIFTEMFRKYTDG